MSVLPPLFCKEGHGEMKPPQSPFAKGEERTWPLRKGEQG